jgi:hypothetical protein
MDKKYWLSILFTAQLLLVAIQVCSQPVHVNLEKKASGWQLKVDGEPFFIRGAVGHSHLELLEEYGGNSLRTGPRRSSLDQLGKLGLKALVNLPANAERYGMNYSDTASVNRQHKAIMEKVKALKDHPAVLMWAIGNELDYIPPLEPFNPAVWDAVNALAADIHCIDPHHPVMTVIGTSMMEKVADIVKRCPDLDLLGINSYGDIYTLRDTLQKYGWNKPYVITEWGPHGYWEVRRTPWGAPYEQTGREKLDCYRDKYLKAIQNNNQCLGSYVFYWEGFKQETTHTWFCMFDIHGNKSPMVELMQSLWKGNGNLPELPVADSMIIDNNPSKVPVFLNAGNEYSSRVYYSGTSDSLTFQWEIRPEAKYAAYAGQGEEEPKPLTGNIKNQDAEIRFMSPETPGPYRLFVYVYDGKGHFTTANLPFYSK